jgi:hypothetical protein
MLNLPTYRETRTAFSVATKPRTRSAGSAVTKKHTVLYLPEFSVNTVWRGASEIVKEFLYELANSISIVRRSTPANANFVACIAWKPTSNTIVRYKLWEDVGEILYVPLYNGEKIGTNFSIEIWNVKPEVGTAGGRTITEDDGELIIVADDADDALVEDGEGELIGTEGTADHEGTALFHLSKLILPTAPNFCEPAAAQILPVSECVDVTMDWTDFVPFDGDYYVVDGNCGETYRVPGSTTQVPTFRLRCEEDQTWHEVYLYEWLGQIHTFVEQDNAAEGVTPSVVIRDIYQKDNGYRVNIVKLPGGEYTLNVEQDTAEPQDYNVIYFLVGALYYGMRVAKQEGQVYIIPSQSGVTL